MLRTAAASGNQARVIGDRRFGRTCGRFSAVNAYYEPMVERRLHVASPKLS
jgi:hypothetical protein